MNNLPILILAYLLGSIPFGLILTRMAGLGDVRHIGSGNIGATNVLRTGKKALAALTLILDALKGTVAVLIAIVSVVGWGIEAGEHNPPVTHDWSPFASGNQFIMLAALLALLGHMYPVWLRFRGGKGVATALGIWLGLSPYVFLGMIATWLAFAFITRISSMGALVAMLVLPVLGYLIVPDYIAVALLTCVLVIWRHRGNIARIAAGTEPKIGKKAGA